MSYKYLPSVVRHDVVAPTRLYRLHIPELEPEIDAYTSSFRENISFSDFECNVAVAIINTDFFFSLASDFEFNDVTVATINTTMLQWQSLTLIPFFPWPQSLDLTMLQWQLLTQRSYSSNH